MYATNAVQCDESTDVSNYWPNPLQLIYLEGPRDLDKSSEWLLEYVAIT